MDGLNFDFILWGKTQNHNPFLPIPFRAWNICSKTKRTAAQNSSSKTTSLFSAQLKVKKYKIRLF